MTEPIIVEFDAAIQRLEALEAAAYRLLGAATCQIDKVSNRFICRLSPIGNSGSESLHTRFVELVTDENVRENLRSRTEPVRNLILSLAFGSLVEPPRTP